jgi:hypothetical protein
MDKKITFKRFLLKILISSVLVFGLFIIFYYLIGRLYILRFNLQIGPKGNILFSPPQIFNFFIINGVVTILCLFFITALILCELGEKKFQGKTTKIKLSLNRFRFIPTAYFFAFLGGLLFTYFIWNNPQKLFPVLSEDKILNLVNEYRFSQKEKQPLTESEFTCQMAEEKLNQLSKSKTYSFDIGGSDQFLEIENNQDEFYAFNYIKNVANENQVLFWWQHSLDQNDIIVTTNYEGKEITKGCVKTIYQPNFSLTVIVVSSI